MKFYLPLFLSLLPLLSANATPPGHISFSSEDDLQRGYYDRPYLRYEAEPDRCELKGEFLLPPDQYKQAILQVDASTLTAANLVNAGDYVQWTADADANAMTLRFSLPDSDDGSGLKTSVSLFVDGKKLTDINLDSYWAWQWMSRAVYNPDNTPSGSKFARMRFDEVNLLLPSTISAGSTFSIVKETETDFPVTIDFVELELTSPVTFSDIEAADKVQYEGDGSTLQSFINANGGKTIYLGPGTYNVPRRLIISTDGTRIVGAGMWYTSINFTASSDNRSTYSQRGIETNSSRCAVADLSLTTVNNKRYYNNNENYQVGKGFMGSWGTGSTISRVRVDHFECGAWIADYAGTASRDLRVEHCRFRNNYADGINLCSGTTGAVVTHCSFRNNGDDDMASWSSTNMASGNEFSYCTAECNWRASSLGFFGGDNNRAHHIAIYDATDCGARVNCVFAGTGFGENLCSMTDITIRRSGNTSRSEIGTFWGPICGAVEIDGGTGTQYTLQNLYLNNIDIYSPRSQGVRINGGRINNLGLHNIYVDGDGVSSVGIYVAASTTGYGQYSNLLVENVGNSTPITDFTRLSNFTFTETSGIDDIMTDSDPTIIGNGNSLSIHDLQPGTAVNLYDITGRLVSSSYITDSSVTFSALSPGVYIIAAGSRTHKTLIR